MKLMPLGRAWPWTLGLLTLAAGNACSCDCCTVAESHTDWSGAAVQTCTLISSNERFLAASRHGTSECADLCIRSRDDLVLYAAGAEVDSVRFCTDERAPQASGRCAPGTAKQSADGNGAPIEVVKPIAFHATKREGNALPASEWPSVQAGMHDVGFRTEELNVAVEDAQKGTKASSELAEKVKITSMQALPKAVDFSELAKSQAEAATDSLRASKDFLSGLQEAADQSGHSVIESTIKSVVKKAHDTAEAEAKVAAAKLEKDMKAKIPAAKAAATKPWVDAMNRAAGVAGAYVKAGDGLGGLAIGDQLSATQMLGSASQFMTLGDVGKGQNLMRDAQTLLGQAQGEASKSQSMYDTASSITGTLGNYMTQAVGAAYNAELMLNPNAPPPPPPIV